jgi:hypothetical protein
MAWSLLFSKFRTGVFLLLGCLQLAPLPGRAQGITLTPPPTIIGCRVTDLDIDPEFVNGPNEYFSVAFDFRNISSSPCILSDASYRGGPSTDPERTDLWGKALSPDSEKRVRGTGPPIDPPLTLGPGAVAHMTMRWKTWPANEAEACVKPGAVNGPVRIVAPSLFERLCSAIEVSAFALGAFQNPTRPIDQTEEQAPSQKLALSSSRSSYYEGERFFLHVSRSGAALAPAPNEDCPTLYLRVRRPNGATEIREHSPAEFSGCRRPGAEMLRPNLDIQPYDGKTGFDLIPDFIDDPSFFLDSHGEVAFQVFERISSADDASFHLAHSNVLRVKFADAVAIPRKWGPQVKGLAVDVALDKDTFVTGEDVPLHLAVENFNSQEQVYGSAIPGNLCGTSAFFKIEVRDLSGQTLPSTDRLRKKSAYAGMQGCPISATPYPKSRVVPFETTLGHEGWLPNHPGTYTVVVTLIPWLGSDEGRGLVVRPVPKEYATIQSDVTLHIADPIVSPSK